MSVWEGSSDSAWFRWGGAALVVLGAVIGVATRPAAVIGMVVAGGALLLFERVEVRIDEGGLRASTRWGWPRVQFPLQEIDRVAVIDVRPLQWGGWGYRGSVRLFRQAAWVLHQGPGIRLDLVGSKVFVVAVDDPTEGAALLEDLKARAR